MDSEILQILANDSFVSGLLIIGGKELILPVMLVFSELHNIPMAMLIAFGCRTTGLLLNYFVVRLILKVLCQDMHIERELRRKNPDPKSHLVNVYLWPLLFLTPFIGLGGGILAIFGVFEVPLKKVLPIVIGTSGLYYVALYSGFSTIFFVGVLVVVAVLLLMNFVCWMGVRKAAKVEATLS